MKKVTPNVPLAIISGGTGHVGSAICDALRNDGWRVAALSRSPSKGDAYRCDITDPTAVMRTVEKIVDTHGPVDACIHAASAKIDKDPAHAADQMAVALGGVQNLAAAALPHLNKNAAFIGITTKLLEAGADQLPTGGYVPAKMALRQFLRKFVEETKERKVRVYAVAPGFIAGGLNEGVPHQVLRMFAQKSGAGMTTAEEVANIVKILCTDAAAYPLSSSIAIPGEAAAL